MNLLILVICSIIYQLNAVNSILFTAPSKRTVPYNIRRLTGGHTVEYIPTEVGRFFIALYRNVPYDKRMLNGDTTFSLSFL